MARRQSKFSRRALSATSPRSETGRHHTSRSENLMRRMQHVSRFRLLSSSLAVAVGLSTGLLLGPVGTAHAAQNTYLSVSVTADGKGYATINAANGDVRT